MKRFRFPLRPVAVLRAHQEARAREAFAASVRAFVKSEEALAAARARIAAFEAELCQGRTGQFSAADESQSLAAYGRERAAEAECERGMLAARAAMQQARIDYLEAHRRTEVVKRLEEKSRLAYRLDCQRAEQADFDDLAGQRFAARRAALSS